jgi:hypothetical protein
MAFFVRDSARTGRLDATFDIRNELHVDIRERGTVEEDSPFDGVVEEESGLAATAADQDCKRT